MSNLFRKIYDCASPEEYFTLFMQRNKWEELTDEQQQWWRTAYLGSGYGDDYEQQGQPLRQQE